MNTLKREDLKELISEQKGVCVSIYMPTHRAGSETQQDPIRLKNLLKEAEEGLIRAGLRTPEADGLLKPAKDLLLDGLFWKHQSDGLVIFLSQDFFRFYRLPTEFPDMAVVTGRFHLKPLLSHFSGDGRFYVLALSQNEVRLFEGSRASLSGVDLEGLPESLSDALKYDNPEKQLQLHTASPHGAGDRSAIFHGHGVGIDETKDNIRRFFLEIDKGLHKLLRDERAPLVLAGVEYLFPIYKGVNTYPHLVDEGIPGNPEAMSEKELHTRTWTLLNPFFLRQMEDAADQYRKLAHTGHASNDLGTIVSASYHGRVEFLFVAVGIQRWGTFDAAAGRINVHGDAESGDEDLLDLAAIQTLLNGGDVHAVESEKVPDGSPLAAVFRY